jgi:hypothetical protein
MKSPEKYNPEEEQKKAIKSFEAYTEEQLKKMTPEERKKFFEDRDRVSKTRKPEPQL